DVGNVDLAVADSAGSCAPQDRLNHRVRLLVADYHFQLDLGFEIYDVLGPTIQLGATLLSTESLNFVGGHTADTDPFELGSDRVQGERLDDRFDLFHAGFAQVRKLGAAPKASNERTCPPLPARALSIGPSDSHQFLVPRAAVSGCDWASSRCHPRSWQHTVPLRSREWTSTNRSGRAPWPADQPWSKLVSPSNPLHSLSKAPREERRRGIRVCCTVDKPR